MKSMRRKTAGLLLGGGLVYSITGGCLPPNFFADLAGDLLTTAATTVFTEFLNTLLNSGAAV